MKKNQVEEINVIIKKTKLEKIGIFLKGTIKLILFLFVVAIIGSAFTLKKHQIFSDLEKTYVNWYDQEIFLTEEEKQKESVAIVDITGMIINDNMGYFEGTSSNTVLQILDEIKQDPNIKAVVLKMDSPGGTIIDSDKISQKISSLNPDKKIYALFENLAASGAYYIASYTDKIFAYDETITGSIGVIMEVPNFQELMDKVGVKMISISSGNMKAMGSPYGEFDEEKKAVFQELVDEAYEKFISIVASNRKIDLAEVKKLADGRIYSGKQALELKLIDSLGGLSALQKEIQDSHLGQANLIKFSVPKSPLEELMGPLGKIKNLLFSNYENKKIMMWYKYL